MLKLVDVTKSYLTSEVETLALRQVNLEIREGEFLAVMGPSGCGKSTLLKILGLLDSAMAGSCSSRRRHPCLRTRADALRRAHIGFVFQNFNLIDDLTVAENVESR